MERKITIEEKLVYREDYQLKMLQANRIEGLLSVHGRGIDERSYYDYDVSGKVSLKAMYEKSNISGGEIKKFLEKLISVIKETERHLLDIHCILLQPEYIFYDDGEYYFCYYPPGGRNLWDEFHRLTEYLVKQADYKDQECVRIVFLLHKETMEENYSLEKLTEECLKSAEESKTGEYGRAEKKGLDLMTEESGEKGFDKEEHDWITEQEMGSTILRETDNLWTPVKRFLNRRKKQKWGDWDGLYIEEDEL